MYFSTTHANKSVKSLCSSIFFILQKSKAFEVNIVYKFETAQGPNINYLSVFNDAGYNWGNLKIRLKVTWEKQIF